MGNPNGVISCLRDQTEKCKQSSFDARGSISKHCEQASVYQPNLE